MGKRAKAAAAGSSKAAKAPAAASSDGAESPSPPPSNKAGRKRKAPAGKAPASAAAEKPYAYLVKSEPHECSIDDVRQRPHQTEGWEGVRNAAARNFMKGMVLGDKAFFYHSSCKVPGIVGIVEVVREAYPDATAQDSSSKYYDAKASTEDPRWFQVDFKLVRTLRRQITLAELKGHAGDRLAGMALFTRPRLSVQPVTQQEWEFVLSLEGQEGEEGA